MNSTSAFDRSEIGVRCVMVSCLSNRLFSLISSMIFCLASFTFSPSSCPAFSFIRPSLLIAIFGVRFISRKNWMSVMSPIELIITTPVPLSIWAKGCGWIGISLLKIGEMAVFPWRCLYRVSSGLKIIISQVAISSGLVVPIMSSSEVSLTFHLMKLNVDSISS